jgi:hypothetical protein
MVKEFFDYLLNIHISVSIIKKLRLKFDMKKMNKVSKISIKKMNYLNFDSIYK